MLRSFFVPIKGETSLCGDNLGIIISCTNLDSELKKKHMEISYHNFRERAADRIVNPLKVCTTVNQSNILTKVVSAGTLVSFSDASYGVDWGYK